MLYIKKSISKKAQQEYENWRQKHLIESNFLRSNLKINSHNDAESFFKKQAENRQFRDRGREIPISRPAYVPEKIKDSPLSHLSIEQREDYLKREEAAKQRTEQLKKQVAPICNKGGLQFITDPADAKTVGRKI